MGQIRVLQPFSASYAKKAVLSALLPRSDQQLRLVSAQVQNNTGSAMDLGIFRNLKNEWNISTVVSTTITDVTSAIKAGTATTILDTTNNDGYVVSCNERFGLVGFIASQADSGSPVYTYQYWNGSALSTLPTFAAPAAYGTSAENLIVFNPPSDWAIGGTIAGVGGMPATQYNIFVKATTASGQNVQVTSAWVAIPLAYQKAVAATASLFWDITSIELALKFNSGDGLLPYFATAGSTNSVYAQFWVQDS